MIGPEARALAATLFPAVMAAGRLQLQTHARGAAVRTKADRSPVTAADEEAEAILLEALRDYAPDVPVIAEERMARGEAVRTRGEFFLVDPLDGTREFIAGRREYTINIALVNDGVPVFGLIYAPALGRLWMTSGPNVAVVIDVAPSEERPFLELPQRRIEARLPPATGMVALVSRSHPDENSERYLARLPVVARKPVGSSLKYCLIASGEADIHVRYGTTSQWDTAAGHAVLAAAGGSISDLEGRPLRYGASAAGWRNPAFVARGRIPDAETSGNAG